MCNRGTKKAVTPLKPESKAPVSRILSMVCVFALWAPMSATAQQSDVSLQQLKEQICLLEAADRDPETTNEVRLLNRRFLEERRQRFGALLIKEIAGLQKYKRSMSEHLTAEENQRIEGKIQDFQKQLESIKQNVAATPPSSPKIAETQSSVPPTEINSSLAQPAGTGPGTTPNLSSPSKSRPDSLTSENSSLQSACYPEAPDRLVRAVRAAAQLFLRGDDPGSQFGEASFLALTHAVAINQGRESLIKAIEIKQLQEQTKRTDKQIGASARSEGSTSAAEKPGFAEILGLAIENGAVQQSISGTTLSLSTTPYTLFAAFNGDSPSDYKEFGYVSRIGFSANFLIENRENVLASARRRQLTGWSIRARLTPDRSTRSAEAGKIWDSISSEFARPNLEITNMLRETFGTNPELEAKRKEIRDRFVGIVAEPAVISIRDNTNLSANEKINNIAEKMLCQIKTDIVDQVESGAFKLDQSTKNRIVNVTLPAYAAALRAKEDALRQFDDQIERLSSKPMLTFAYDNVRPATQTNYSVLSVLFEKKTGTSLSAVANAGFSFYQHPNPALKQQTLRDFAVALSFEGKAGRSPFLVEGDDKSQITYSFTSRYQRFLENRFLSGRKADIAVAQFKLNVPMFAAVSLPFSVTYANATEWVKEDHVRANFGFSFDADKLLKVIKLRRLTGQ